MFGKTIVVEPAGMKRTRSRGPQTDDKCYSCGRRGHWSEHTLHWIHWGDITWIWILTQIERHNPDDFVWLQNRANECDEKKRRYTSSSIKSPNWCLNQGTEEDRRARVALDQDREGISIGIFRFVLKKRESFIAINSWLLAVFAHSIIEYCCKELLKLTIMNWNVWQKLLFEVTCMLFLYN